MTTRRPRLDDEYAVARPRSRALWERACRSMPSGAVHDGRVFSPFPFYVERADGARKWDVDGHVYLDGWSGHGALVLGHNHPAIVAAITEQARRGLHYSACHELEVRWAELIRSCVPGAEKVRFTLTGTETTALAVRVARAATGREHIVKFEGHFHGVHDALVPAVKAPFEIPMSAGVPAGTRATTLVARHNDIDHVRELLDEHPVAAVILEPAGGRSMTAPTNPAFLRALRELTRARGIVLIFDEVVTGFRMAAGGAQEYFGVTADLTCLAKAVAGGLPGAALVGRADLLDAIAFTGDAARDRTRRVADQGTHSAAPLVAAAGIAALEILRTGEVQRELNRLGDRLRAGLDQTLKTRGVRGCAYGASSMFRIFLGADADELGLTTWTLDSARLDRGNGPLGGALHLALLLHGVDINRGSSGGWLNAAMTDADIDAIVDAFDRSLVRLREEGWLDAVTA
ncbi:MAG TPA: aminotransferase class III-fold pyridoxal phosphate-dependent enzyme [Candidatus Tectomicrobia bacterium]|nr:aminotransferase class III-fold pyridoxal phosphate-dependent enzyme [Candidatus Tectomicrobia bacterium]